MTHEEQVEFLEREYAEAVRYMDNAREVLSKSRRDGHYYEDKKYVRTACGTAYSGVLVALDAWLVMKGVLEPPRKKQKPVSTRKPGKGAKLRKIKRKSIDFYTDSIAQLDLKLLDTLNSLYGILHLDGYYDGNGDGRAIATGFNMADDIIERIKPYSRAA